MDIRTAIRIIEGLGPDDAGETTYFGGWKPGDGLDGWTTRQFLEGDCGYLALALSEETGWPIFCETNGSDGNHVWVVNDNGRAVDIQGVHPTDYATFPGCPKRKSSRRVEEIDAGSQETLCWNKPLLDLARAIVKNFPGHFGLRA